MLTQVLHEQSQCGGPLCFTASEDGGYAFCMAEVIHSNHKGGCSTTVQGACTCADACSLLARNTFEGPGILFGALLTQATRHSTQKQ